MTSIAEQVGRVVGGRYRLLAPVGTGASSQVYAASDTRLARRVAVKVLHPMLAGDRAFLRRFSAEARLAASLDHRHIMRVFDWGEEAWGPYLVLEYLGGGSLRSLLDTGVRLSHSQVTAIGSEAAAGLAYAHRRGIVHRDVKPSNLLFDDEGHLRIADFGVARALAASALTEPLGAIFGTARYASPEQAEGRPLDDRTDVYSLALVLYEALTGRVPFSGDTITAMLMARVGAILPSAAELGPLAPILAQAAISEPLARLDAAALYSDLELLGRELPQAEPLPLERTPGEVGATSWQDRDPTVSESAGVGTKVPALELPAADDARPDNRVDAGPGRAPRHRRLRWLIWLAVVAVLAATAGASAVAIHDAMYGHIVPSLKSMTLAGAERAAARAGLVARETSNPFDAKVPAGVVIGQSIAAGRHERAHTVVGVAVSRGVEPVPVPALAGLSYITAVRRLTAGHLQHRLHYGYSDTVAPGQVISWTPREGDVAPGRVVLVTISDGPAPRAVPSVPRTDTFFEARQLLASYGFKVVEATAYSLAVGAHLVISTSPGPSSGVQPYGSSVTVTISLGPESFVIPKLVGDSVAKARQILQGMGFVVKVERFGSVVIDTYPARGSLEVQGSTVYVFAV